jgi:putative membrane protein
MIRGYGDHAANERTFLAWVRTGLAVIAFGFVIDKLDPTLLAAAGASAPEGRPALGPLGRYDGLALVLVGIALILVAAARFVRIGRMLDDPAMHAAATVRTELILSATLALIVAGFTAYIVLGS